VSVGISDYACVLARARLDREAVEQWGWSAPRGWRSSAVAWPDEDALTLGIDAARALGTAGGVGALGLACTRLPYRQRVQAGLIAEALGLGDGVLATEHTTSERAGTEALTLLAGEVTRRGRDALLVAADPGAASTRELDRSAGAVALRLGPQGQVASLDATAHQVGERPGLRFVLAGAREVRDVDVADYAVASYGATIVTAVEAVLRELAVALEAFRWVVLGGVRGDLAAKAASVIGAAREQWAPVLPYTLVGDTGAAGALFGLVAALDAAAPGDRILVVSYGSGSAADVLALTAGAGSGRARLAAAGESSRPLDLATFVKLGEER
jgi:3-hydroxy-3-methylglutaryl CoA synthase